ncbi:PAS-domain containing protein [Halodurantibacterium flavum]|uniref:PAS-domain containing protein n=1 Tax=Halodurantibacterium flavum TaxID=1382802 RepID=A0ABW4S9J0_9RHOB
MVNEVWSFVPALLVSAGLLVALAWMLFRHSLSNEPGGGLFDAGSGDIVFLFEGKRLVDATARARALLAASGTEGGDWPALLSWLSQYFPDAAALLARAEETGSAAAVSQGSRQLELEACLQDGLTRITLLEPGVDGQVVTLDAGSYRATRDELATLRATVEHAPVLSWREGPDGAVIWANRAYLDAVLANGYELGWPLPALFDKSRLRAEPRRLQPNAANEARKSWYECQAVPLPDGRLCFGVPSDATVRAEGQMQSFMQTLVKTFAHLPVGLAIFDPQRRLHLFNPALTDLTGLEFEFLAARPTLAAFLDQLRDRRMLPEPRDYRSWRQQFTELEHGRDGHYEETWTLPTGQTYRVSGRPHSDGAVALLVEDITAEITLTRRFRAELETGQAVLDAMDEAVIVFSGSGVATMANRAYAALWGVDPMSALSEITLQDSVRQWQATDRGTDWMALSAMASAREPASRRIVSDLGQIVVRTIPLAGGSLMIGFRREATPAPVTAPVIPPVTGPVTEQAV